MTTATLIKTVHASTPTYVGKRPVVMLPLDTWEEIQDYVEDIEANRSKQLKKDIDRGRKDIKAGKGILLKDLL